MSETLDVLYLIVAKLLQDKLGRNILFCLLLMVTDLGKKLSEHESHGVSDFVRSNEA